jgi:predicted RNA-binding Zn-ribbon protein involved in translation (DUF1610 family)
MLWHARRRNRKDGWASYAWRTKFNTEQWPAWSWRNLEPVMPDDEQSRWLRYYEIRQAKSFKRIERTSPQACRKCGSTNIHRTPGSGPHAAGLRCNDCGHHLGWVSKQEVNA